MQPLDPETAARDRAARLQNIAGVTAAAATLKGDAWTVEVTTTQHDEPVQVVDAEDEAWLTRDLATSR